MIRVVAFAADKPVSFARSYGGKCLDFGAPPHVSGSPVFIYDCNGSIAQQIRIEEVNNRHDVSLRAGNKVIGVKMEQIIGPTEGGSSSAEAETPLELQNEKDRNTVLSRGQIFALDGDSIILAANSDSVSRCRTTGARAGPPVVLGRRELADNEFWTLTPTDNSNRKPTDRLCTRAAGKGFHHGHFRCESGYTPRSCVLGNGHRSGSGLH